MLPSGTRNAREMPGFSRGSSRRACAGSISSHGIPVSLHPAANRSAYSGSSNGVVTKNPPVSSTHAEATLRMIPFS